jgi:hypothetical protein
MSVWRPLNAGRLEIAKARGIGRASIYQVMEVGQ